MSSFNLKKKYAYRTMKVWSSSGEIQNKNSELETEFHRTYLIYISSKITHKSCDSRWMELESKKLKLKRQNPELRTYSWSRFYKCKTRAQP